MARSSVTPYLAVERALLDRVGAERPRDAVVSEEAGSIGDGRRVWTIDPVDGTASFLARGRLWGTNIALAVDGEQTIGVVSSPPLGTYSGNACVANLPDRVVHVGRDAACRSTLSQASKRRPTSSGAWLPAS